MTPKHVCDGIGESEGEGVGDCTGAIRGDVANEDTLEEGWVLPVVEVVRYPAYLAESNQPFEVVRAASSVCSAGTVTGTIGRFQVGGGECTCDASVRVLCV